MFDRGQFIIEYVGEVLEYVEFRARTKRYSKVDHFYFMALNGNEILDAAKKGNASRFINHSCDPNCETQKVSSSSCSGGRVHKQSGSVKRCSGNMSPIS